MTGGFFAQRGSNAENIWIRWRHNEKESAGDERSSLTKGR